MLPSAPSRKLRRDILIHRHMRSVASEGEGEGSSWDMTIPVVCMRTVDGEGDAGKGSEESKYSIYLCPVDAKDPMTAVMMCGQVGRGFVSRVSVFFVW